MMIIPITFPSAAQLWLNYMPSVIAPGQYERIDLPAEFELPSDKTSAGILLNHLPFDLPVSVLSPLTKRSYMNNSIIRANKHPAHIPPNSFVRISSSLYAASPEYCFLQAANQLSLEKLVMFGNDLCSKYVHDESARYRQRSRVPVTNAESIRNYVGSAKGCHGYRKALQASSYILDNSNSFMESMLAVFIVLPFSLGGFKLYIPELNKMPVLSEEGLKLMDGRPCYCDIVWEIRKLIVEYDSEISHLTSRQHSKDKQRASALSASGYKVISITRKNVEFLSDLDETFLTLRRLLGMRPADKELAQYIDKRREVFRSFRTFQSYNPDTYMLR